MRTTQTKQSSISIKAELSTICPKNTPFQPVSLSRPTENYLNQIQKLDSVHDFGGSRGGNLATDTITKSRDSGAFCYDQMILSFIQKYSFQDSRNDLLKYIPDMPIQTVSNFSSPGIGQYPRFVDDIESYLMYCAINDATTMRSKTYGTNFLCVENTEDVGELYRIKKQLRDFFGNYRDIKQEGEEDTDKIKNGTGKINFIVDTPGDFTKILKSDTFEELGLDEIDEFAYVLTQESAHDSAKGKPTTLSPLIIDEAYKGNGFCEAFIDEQKQERTYSFNNTQPDVPGTFESNFTITFKGMNYEPTNGENFFTNVTYTKQGTEPNVVKCKLNATDHPTNIPKITKEIAKIARVSSKPLNTTSKTILEEPRQLDYIKNFYIDFKRNNYQLDNNKPYLLDFNFTKKRAGDGLQARICQYINSGRIKLRCYKKNNPKPGQRGATGSELKGGLDTRIIYKISKLILVTIDKVLFSYCVKNDIPAIYSGTKIFIFFKPEAGLTADILPSSVPNGIVFTPAPAIRNKRPNTFGGKKSVRQTSEHFQKGGNMSDFFNTINDIPYIIFKLSPRILNQIKETRETTIKEYATILTNIKDADIETYYGNGLSVLIYKDEGQFSNSIPEGPNGVISSSNENEPRTIIYLSKGDLYYKVDFQPRASRYTITYDDKYKTVEGTIIMDILAGIKGIMKKSNVRDFVSSFGISSITGFIDNYWVSEDDIGELDESEEQLLSDIGLKQTGGVNKNLLDLYIDTIINSPNLLDNSKLKEDNFIALMSYINIFTCYEVAFCYDNDIYEQRFNNINGLEVSNCIGLYIMYDLLLNDFSEQITKISYKLMEYFINSGDSAQNYLSISTDLMELLQYVYCDDTRLSESLNTKTEQQIQNGIINTSDPIFIASQTYFVDLFGRIQTKKSEVKAFLNGTNQDPNIGNYIKNNLSMYGFMNMTNSYLDKFTPTSSVATPIPSDLARGYPLGEERKQQIESQKLRAQTQKNIPAKSFFKPFQGKTMTMKELKEKNIESAPEGNIVYSYNAPNRGNTIGGKYKTRKNLYKNRKTRKNRKVNRKHRYMRKTKRINKKTRKN